MNERKDMSRQAFDDPLTVFVRHHGMKSPICAVRHAPSVMERFDDRVFGAAENRNPLRGHRDVVGASGTRQAGCAMRRKLICICIGIVVDDPAGHHGAKPFADVSLVQLRSFRNLAR